MVSGVYLKGKKNISRCETRLEYRWNCLCLFLVKFKACNEEMSLICFYAWPYWSDLANS